MKALSPDSPICPTSKWMCQRGAQLRGDLDMRTRRGDWPLPSSCTGGSRGSRESQDPIKLSAPFCSGIIVKRTRFQGCAMQRSQRRNGRMSIRAAQFESLLEFQRVGLPVGVLCDLMFRPAPDASVPGRPRHRTAVPAGRPAKRSLSPQPALTPITHVNYLHA